MRRLHNYLISMDGSWGCAADYEEAVCPSNNMAWLAGHYSGLLDDLVRAIGRKTLINLIEARMDIEAAMKKGEVE